MNHRWALWIGWLLAIGVVGCGTPGGPRTRIGALPFPGPFTLWETADPDHLGRHRSIGFPPYPVGPYECQRGILYTTEAGFLDIAHVRDTIDWTRYCAVHVRSALRDGTPRLALPVSDRATFHLAFAPLDGIARSDDDEREAVLDEYAIRVGQQLAYLLMTWHEVQTWYGYKSAGVVSEKRSAFTYDDLISHVVGVDVAGEALRRGGDRDVATFDAEVTRLLDAELKRLGAVRPGETTRAAEAVRGKWWRNASPIKRQLDTGIETGEIRPWLVPEFAGSRPARRFELPSLADVRGRDLTATYDVTIEPRIWESNQIRAVLPGRPRRIEPARDLPILIQDIRDAVRRQDGPDADHVGTTEVASHP